MDVDESGSNVLAARIDHARGLCVGKRPDCRDTPVLNPDVRGKPRIAGAVHHAAVLDQHIKPLSRLCESSEKGGKNCDGYRTPGLHAGHSSGSACLARATRPADRARYDCARTLEPAATCRAK